MNPIDILQRLKANNDFSSSELVSMLSEVEDFNPKDGYMEHVMTKCEKLILDRLFRTPREGR